VQIFTPDKKPISMLVLGLGLILILMTSLVLSTFFRMQESYQQIEAIVHVHSTKINLSYKMLVAGRQRSMHLHTMLVLSDPFDIDDVWLKYKQMAVDFIQNRQALLDFKLSKEEQVLFTEQGRKINISANIQSQVVELLFLGKTEQARQLLISQSIPRQDEVVILTKRLISHYEQNNNRAVEQAYLDYKQHVMSLFLFSIAIILISIFIAVSVVVYFKNNNANLNKQVLERTKALQAASDRAEIATQNKSEFIAYISHEIRNPLHGMLGLVEASLEEDLSKNVAVNLSNAYQSGEILLRLLNDVLDLSKMEAGKLELEYIDYQFEDMLATIEKLLSARIRDKKLNFELKLNADVPAWIHGDPTRLSQILINLITNAIKFTPSGGRISVSIDTKTQSNNQTYLYLSLCDNGQGINEQVLPTLFQAYQQADKTIARQFGGTGLGLALCKQLVELMGGKIWVNSTFGEGSEFGFYIPCTVAQNTHVKPHKTTQNLSTMVVYQRGLLVEDNLVNQKVALLHLNKFIVKTDVANNGQEALEACQQHQYGIIFMDCQMPIMDGFEAARAIRTDSLNQKTPIIAMTGLGLDNERQQCIDAGMDDVLVKPYKRADVKQKIFDFKDHVHL